jgi:hypothetical protein
MSASWLARITDVSHSTQPSFDKYIYIHVTTTAMKIDHVSISPLNLLISFTVNPSSLLASSNL